MNAHGRELASRAALVKTRDDLLSSLEDLERERAAGDVSEEHYASLHARYTSRAAEAIRALEDVADVAPLYQAWRAVSVRQFLARRKTRRVLVVVALLCVLGLIGTLVQSLTGVRLSGQQVTGSINLPTSTQIQQDLAQASVLGSSGQLQDAINLYDAVLAKVPDQPEALTYKGWLERLAGLAAHDKVAVKTGDALIARAVKVAPDYSDAHALYGLSLLEDDHDETGALGQFNAFLAHKPSPDLLGALGATMVDTFVQAHQKIPAALSSFKPTTSP